MTLFTNTPQITGSEAEGCSLPEYHFCPAKLTLRLICVSTIFRTRISGCCTTKRYVASW